MKHFPTVLASAVMLASPLLAQGSADEGEKIFRQCRSCHMIASPDGEEIQKGGKVGPNLYGVIGRTAGSQAEFAQYSDAMVDAGEAGLAWDEESFSAYVQDPTAFLREYLDDPSARGKMTFKLRNGMEDIYAYLATFSDGS